MHVYTTRYSTIDELTTEQPQQNHTHHQIILQKNKNRKYLVTHIWFLEPCHAVCVLGGGGGISYNLIYQIV